VEPLVKARGGGAVGLGRLASALRRLRLTLRTQAGHHCERRGTIAVDAFHALRPEAI